MKYALDLEQTKEAIIIESNHCVCLGSKKSDGILCPNQLRINGVYFDDRPSTFFSGVENTQCIICGGQKLPLIMTGPLMELPVCQSTLNEITNDDIQVITLTFPHDWDPYGDDFISFYQGSSLMCMLPWGNPIHLLPQCTVGQIC